MIDTKTKNTSFINLWRYLQDRDIDNAELCLTLNNPELRNIDLFLEKYDVLNNKLDDFSIEQKDELNKLKAKIIEECKENIWFFFREVIRIPNTISKLMGLDTFFESSKFIICPPTYLMIYLYDKGVSFIMNRRNVPEGITTTLKLLTFYHMAFREYDIGRNPLVACIETGNIRSELKKIFEDNYCLNPVSDYADYFYYRTVCYPISTYKEVVTDFKETETFLFFNKFSTMSFCAILDYIKQHDNPIFGCLEFNGENLEDRILSDMDNVLNYDRSHEKCDFLKKSVSSLIQDTYIEKCVVNDEDLIEILSTDIKTTYDHKILFII